jgi:hypothetical protein
MSLSKITAGEENGFVPVLIHVQAQANSGAKDR